MMCWAVVCGNGVADKRTIVDEDGVVLECLVYWRVRAVVRGLMMREVFP